MDPEKDDLIRTLQELQHSIEEGVIENIEKITNSFQQNVARNKDLLSELYTSGTRCTTQTDLILAACENKQEDILYYMLKETDILLHLTDDSFDDTEVNRQRTEAIKHALRLDAFNMVEMLYDFWCGNLHWSGHDINNIEVVGNVLQSASDACSDNDDQLKANFHCLLTLNAFQREMYTELAGPKPCDITPTETATTLQRVLRIYVEYSHPEKIRRTHSNKERDLARTANINDDSSMYYKNQEYIYYEVYFRKLDFNISLVVLENLFVLRKYLETRFNKTKKYFEDNPDNYDVYKQAADMYESIESAIYHFNYRTSEHWRLYLPENRQILIQEYIVNHNSRIKITRDLHKWYNGPVICLERESFKKSLEKLKEILEEYVIREDPDLVWTQNNQNDKSKEVTLLNKNYLETVTYMRDHYSLMKIVYYIEAIEKTTNINVFMVERVLHVVGEMLKSTDDSRHVSRSTQALLQMAISVETVDHLQKIRDFLSHAREGQLSTRINMADTQTKRFQKIKEELMMIKEIINPILDVFKSILDKSLLKKGLRLLEQRITGLPDVAKCIVDDIYRLHKIHKNELVLVTGDFYEGFWKHTGLTHQLLKEIPWIMQNRAKILKDIQLVKTRINDKFVRILPSLTPYVRHVLKLIDQQNNNYVKTINQYDKSVQMSEYPDKKEINEIKPKLEKLMRTNKSLKIDLGLLNKIKNYKHHWESVKEMLSFCVTECELFAPLKPYLTGLAVAEAYNILAEMEVISVLHRSTLAWLTGTKAVVLGLKIYRKYEDWVSWLFGLRFYQKHFNDIEALHNEQNVSIKIKPADPRLARETLILCLVRRLDLLKQTLQQLSLSQLVRRYEHDVKFRLTLEMILADIANVLDDCIRNVKPSFMCKSSKMLLAINLGNVLDHGNPFLEVIGDIFNPYDLAAEWLKKAMMFTDNEYVESIKALYELFKGKMDSRTILAGDLLKMNDDQQKQYAKFIKNRNWESYALLTRYPIPKSQRIAI